MGRCFGDAERARIAEALDAQVPGATALGAVEYVENLLTALDHDPPRIWAGPDGWLELGPWERHAWAQRIEDLRARYARVGAGDDLETGDLRVLHAHAIEATYGDPAYGGNREQRGLAADRLPGAALPTGARMTADCDVVVVGSGPGGATVAEVLTAAGWSVIVLEKGRNHLVDLTPPHEPLRHFANDEIALSRRHLLGPDPLLEPRTYRRSLDDGERLLTGDVNNLPSTVGGGGVHADAKLPRFREEDFRLRSERGPVDGARVEDWPFGYDELEAHYAAVERSFGVAGEDGANPFAAWRSSSFPMPPGEDMPMAVVSAAAAERAGLHPYRAPTGVNSVVYDGRPACVDCGFCGGYGCPIHAKGDPIAALQRAPCAAGDASSDPTHSSRSSCSTRAGAGPPACGTSTSPPTPILRPSRCEPPGRSFWPPVPSRRHDCCCATTSAVPRSAATSRTTSRPSRSASSRSPPVVSVVAASRTSTTTS